MNVTRYARRIQPLVSTALQIGDEAERRQALETIAENAFAVAYDDRVRNDSDDDLTPDDVASFTAGLDALDYTTSDSSPERVADWIARSADNYAAVKAAPSDTVLEWRTQRDDAVRDIHAAADGQQRKPGDPFDIAGVPMLYPGQPTGTPEHWANCRCRLVAGTPGLAADGLVARTFTAEQRRKMADSGQAMPDGSYPIANEEDLRNAIQAIGRAKDPAAVKRHIRKRARALGLSDLVPEAWTASAEEYEELVAAPVPKPANTHDAPGWLTNPRETQRLRTYWTKGEGAAKIRWGTEGDLTRCHRFLAKYVEPQWVWATCNNLHHVVFGFFNPQSERGDASINVSYNDQITAAFAAADLLEDPMLPPRSLFEDPGLAMPTPMTLRAAGDFVEYVGHLASWDTCHVGMSGGCTTAPRSAHDYAYFRTGEVETDDGFVPVGHITAGTGHADLSLDAAATVRHYDDTGTVAADVAVGEDAHGIWAHGIARPGITEEQLYALRAGAPSGDWRTIGGALELVGALIVNVPGFPIPRTQVASVGEREVALVAAAIVTGDPSAAIHVQEIAVAVVETMERRAAEAERLGQRRGAILAALDRDRAARAKRIAERIKVGV